MQNTITPEQVEAAALKARLPLTTFIRQAGIAPSVFYRWRGGAAMRPLTMARFIDAVNEIHRGEAVTGAMNGGGVCPPGPASNHSKGE